MKDTIKELKKEIKRLRALIDYDFLTGLYNRQGFIRESEKFLEEIKKEGKLKERRKITIRFFSIIFIDLDNLKTINDNYGHQAGDRALKIAANIFKKSVRKIDIIGRWGGDEFVIGLVDADEKIAIKIDEKIREKLKKTKIRGQKLSASFGIITVSNEKIKRNLLNLYNLIKKADKAMYEVKKKSKGFVAIYQ
jgi:diguanylate cyclase (GGDEF)-like protein